MISEKVVMLNLRTRQLCKECDFGAAITQRMRFLFLLKDESRTPHELEDRLSIAKPNLTILAAKMESDGLIKKHQFARDKRAIYYEITDAGREELASTLKTIDSYYARKSGERDSDKGEKKLDAALSVFNFLD